MDPYDSPLRSAVVSPSNPFPHSLQRTRDKIWSTRVVLRSSVEGFMV